MHDYKFHIGDYRRDTGHLTVEEHGIYRVLLDELYLQETALTSDTHILSRKLRLTSDQKPLLETILSEFFELTEDGYTHNRVSVELSRIYSISAQATANINKRWDKHKEKNGRNTGVIRANNGRNTDAILPSNPVTQVPSNPVTQIPSNPPTQQPIKVKSIVELKPDDVRDIFAYWQMLLNHPRAAFDQKRQALIKKQLGNYSKADLMKAIFGCSITPHNMGDNDRGEVYDSIELILREAKQIDRFMRNADNPPTHGVTTLKQTVNRIQSQSDRLTSQFGDKK